MNAVLESARNVACAGGTPLAITNCLNFGNPEKPDVAWELTEAIEGMALACEALGVPVVSGNVSLYNETDGRAIDPTPVVGCVGTVEDVRTIPSKWQEGDVVLLAGDAPVALDGSEFQARFLGGIAGCPPRPDLDAESGADLVPRAQRRGADEPHTTPPTAASRSRSPSWRSGRSSAPRSSSTATP